LQFTVGGAAVWDMADSTHQNIRGCELRDLTLDGGSAFPNNEGFHFGGTIYSRTDSVMIRNFGSCIMVENTAGPNGGHWTERFDFSKTVTSECNNQIFFHVNGGNNSFMHGKMDVYFGMFGVQNGLVIDGGANVANEDFQINGNMAPDSTGSLVKIMGGSYLTGKMTLLPECMNSSLCTRMNIDATSHFNGQIFGGIAGGWQDIQPPGADFQAAYADSRFVAPIHATCQGLESMTPGQTLEMFSVQNWGSWAAGPLAIASRYTGNSTAKLYALAAEACSNNPSLTATQTTNYAGGAPFTVTETCHPSDVIGNGTAAHPQYPQGTVSYNITSNATQTVSVSWSFMNIILDNLNSKVIGRVPGMCF
jgi:hypothetical protein